MGAIAFNRNAVLATYRSISAVDRTDKNFPALPVRSFLLSDRSFCAVFGCDAIQPCTQPLTSSFTIDGEDRAACSDETDRPTGGLDQRGLMEPIDK